MKKPQRSFVIEYKSGRRRSGAKQPNSIWGNLDLKSVARDVETVLPAERSDSHGPGDDLIPRPQTNVTPADPSVSLTVNESAACIDRHSPVEANAPSEAREPGLLANTQKLNRQPSDQTETKNSATPRKVAGKKRRAVKRRPPSSEPILATDVTDEFDDLLQLEEENRLLKRMLVDRLRAENSWIRDRLQCG